MPGNFPDEFFVFIEKRVISIFDHMFSATTIEKTRNVRPSFPKLED